MGAVAYRARRPYLRGENRTLPPFTPPGYIGGIVSPALRAATTARGAWSLRTRASRAAVRWERAAVIALLAAFAVLIHHETPASAIEPTPSSAVHVMTPGMVMAGSHGAPATAVSGHAHGRAPAQAAVPTATAPATNSADGPACSSTAMQHCSTASLDVVKLAAPQETPAPWDPPARGAVTGRPAHGRGRRRDRPHLRRG